MKHHLYILSILACLFTGSLFAQGVGIGTTSPDPSAKLDISSNTQGTLITRLTTAQRNAILNPAEGLLIFNTSTKCFESFVNSGWYTVSCPCAVPASVNAGTHVASGIQIVWNWNTVPSATGYKWNTVDDYSTATDLQNTNTFTQNGLSCGMNDSVYVWSYNVCGHSASTKLNQSTAACSSGGGRVFLSSTTYTANLGGTAGADNSCQSRANAASLGGSWKAWVSLSGSSPSSRFNKLSSAYTLVTGTPIANDWNDLTDGSIANPINVDEFGNTVTTSVAAWTNTNTDGTFNSNSYGGCGGSVCNGWTLGSGCNNPNCGQLGDGGSSNTYWSVGGASCCDNAFRLYCFEQ